MDAELKQNVTRRGVWLRLGYMIVLTIAFNVAEMVCFAVVVFQFLASLFSGKPNDNLKNFGVNLGSYIRQIILFLTFATEEMPFPFAPWPQDEKAEGGDLTEKTA